MVESPAEGTIYLHTSGVDADQSIKGNKHLAAVHKGKGQMYQKIEIDGNRLRFRTLDIDGNVVDEFRIEK